MSDHERAWAAGFFDGEGNIRCAIREGRRSVLTLQISQSDPFVLERFRIVVGVGAVRGPYPTRTKSVYKFECSGESAVTAFEVIKPFLSVPKLVQGEKAKQDFYGFRTKT